MSESAAHGTLYTVAAPSGAGKTSLLDALLDRRGDAVLSISHTTRPPRPSEQDGEHYHFIDEAQFATMKDAGEFLEHAQVFGHRYGTSRAPVEAQLAAGRDVILEIDWQGARQVRDQIAKTVGIFILPPSRNALIERLKNRGQDSQTVIAARMGEADQELSHYNEFDYLIVNDDFGQALLDLDAILRSRRLGGDLQQQRHEALLRDLLSQGLETEFERGKA